MRWKCSSGAVKPSITSASRFIQSIHANESYNHSDAASEKYYTVTIPDGTADFVFSISLFTHFVEAQLEDKYLGEPFRVLEPAPA